MKENKVKKKAYLYLVLGMLLTIAIAVGGVYAYFAARATNSGQTITGQTLDINGTTLSIAAQKLNLVPSPAPQGYSAPVSDNLVPANFGVTASNMTTTEVNRALDNYCEGGGYTGCHVWKITATSSQTLPSANVKLNLRLVGVTDEEQWSYIVYTGTDSSATTILNKGTIATDFPTSGSTIDIHSGASLTANTSAIYYVMVYLNNINSAQNDGETENTTDERGTYNGSVTLEAMGGEVKVDFLAPPTAAEFFVYEIQNGEVIIGRYKSEAAFYTVSNQTACENYLQQTFEVPSDMATTLCTGGNIDGTTLGDAIALGAIPSSDYASAGLSNVTITPAPTDLIIPSEIEGYPVTTIYANTFQNKELTSVVIPDSVTTIGDYAFSENSLTSVEIPDSVTEIGNYVFANNSLTSVEIPNSVTTISNTAFDNALDTTNGVTLNIDMTTIPARMFLSKGIVNLVLGNHVTTINNNAFSGNLLTSIEIPSNVTTIGAYAFSDNALTSITIRNTSTTIGNCAFGNNPPLGEPFSTNYACQNQAYH